MNKIPGIREGRDGVWLITPFEAATLIREAPGDEIHNFIGSGPTQIGCNWPKEDAIKLVNTEGKRIAMVFPPNMHMRHHLVVLDDEKRWSFDVGAIDESRMVDERNRVCQPGNIWELFHQCWGQAQESPEYDKAKWLAIEKAIIVLQNPKTETAP